MTNAKLQLEIKQANEISLLVCKGKVYSDKEWISKESVENKLEISIVSFAGAISGIEGAKGKLEISDIVEQLQKYFRWKELDNIVHNVKGEGKE